jgi:hypothetical protein
MTLSAKVDPALETKLAKAQAARANELAAIHEVTIESAEDYTFADTLLTECARNRDALVEQRKTVTTPLYTVIRTVEGWFKPSVSELEGAIDHLKKVMGGWRIEQARAEQEARRAALAAAKAQDTPAVHAALERVHKLRLGVPRCAGRGRLRWWILPPSLASSCAWTWLRSGTWPRPRARATCLPRACQA